MHDLPGHLAADKSCPYYFYYNEATAANWLSLIIRRALAALPRYQHQRILHQVRRPAQQSRRPKSLRKQDLAKQCTNPPIQIKNIEELEKAKHELHRIAEEKKAKELREGS